MIRMYREYMGTQKNGNQTRVDPDWKHLRWLSGGGDIGNIVGRITGEKPG